MRIGERVFELTGVDEKKKEREGPGTQLPLLGFDFDVEARQLSVPRTKAEEMIGFIESILARTEANQCVSHQELSSIVGCLPWAGTGVERGRAYLREIRSPLVAVMDLLTSRLLREQFCIPLYLFKEAVAELGWWLEALRMGGGAQTWHVGSNGKFYRFRWAVTTPAMWTNHKWMSCSKHNSLTRRAIPVSTPELLLPLLMAVIALMLSHHPIILRQRHCRPIC